MLRDVVLKLVQNPMIESDSTYDQQAYDTMAAMDIEFNLPVACRTKQLSEAKVKQTH